MIFNRATIIKLTLFVILLSNLVLKSQTIVTIGSNTTTVNTERYPFNGYYNYNWASQIYLNSEVGGSGTLTAVSFSVTNSPSNYTMTAQKIYVRQTTASSYTSSTYPTITGFTLVFDGTIIYNGNGWKTITFTTPFVYNANSNLEFLFENRDGSFASGFPYFAYTTTTGANRLKRDYRDASFPTTCAACSALNNIINIRITKNCSSNPSISISANSTSVCVGNSVTIVASGADTYMWNPTTGLNTSSSASVQASPIGNTTYTVTGTLGGCIGSNTTTVNVIPVNAGVAIATGATNTCQNQNVNLSIQNQIANPLHTFVIWQSSLDNIAYTDISGATSQLYSTAVNTSTYFRAKFSNGTCIGYSTPVYYATSNNYYVNDNSITGDIYTMAIGSSSNNGKSKLSPKASVNDIITSYNLGPCDTIFVDSGSYIEEINFAGLDNGSSQGYITLIGAGIDKSVYTAPLSKNNILLNASRYININNFTFNSTQSLYYNINVQSSERNLISSNKFNHSTSSNIYFFGSVNKSNLNRVISNTISNGSNFGSGVYIEGNADSIMVSNNDITMTHASSISGIYVTSYYTSSANYYPAHGSVSQNTITAPNYGIKLYGSSYPISTYTINNNIINIQTKAPTEGACIWLGTVGTSNNDKTIIYNNRLNGGTNGIYLSTNADYIKVYNNYISGSDNGLNVSASNSEIGEVYFNSFYNSLNNLYFSFSSAAYWKVKNNILYNTNASASNACVSIGNSGVTFSAYNYNAYYAPNGASIGRISTTNYTTLAAWRGVDHSDETPKGDENSIVGNPLYINVSQNNLDVVSSSPVAASGTVISGITNDIYNTTRSNPTFIGAQEIPFSVAICNTQTITCTIPSATLTGTTASSGVSFSWIGPSSGTPAGSSPSSSLTIVSAAGIYTLTVTKSGNTPITLTVQVVFNQTLPNVSAGTYKIISPTSPSATLTGSSSTSGVTYSWTPGGSAPTNSITVVSAVGIYTLSVTNPVNGCVASSTVLVANKLSATATITDYENDSLKGKVSLNICGGIPPFNIAWNGVKYPLPANAYKLLKDSLPSITVDSVKFVNYIDSLRQRTVFNDLLPSTNFAVIYDQTNDSVVLRLSVAQKITSWAATVGVVTSTAAVNSIQAGGVNYFYGPGVTITQNGVFSAGNTYAALPNLIDLNKTNEISFSIPDNLTTAYIGMFDQNSPLSGSYFDLNQKTMFKFNGNGTFDVIFNSQSILNSTYASGDQFALRTNSILGKISYFKNEVLLAEANIADLNLGSTLLLSKVILGNSGASVAGLKIKLRDKIITIEVGPFNKCILLLDFDTVNIVASPNPVCFGSNVTLTGSLTQIQLLGGNSNPITLPNSAYKWLPGNVNSPSTTITNIQSSQLYTLEIVYSGCLLKNTKNVIVNKLIADAGPDKVYSNSPVVIGGNPSASFGQTPYSYRWLPNTGFVLSNGIFLPNPSVVPIASNTYTLTVTDNNLCTATDVMSVSLVTSFSNNYATLTKQIDGGYYQVTNNKVYFKFEEEYKGIALNYNIYNYSNTTLNTPINLVTTCSDLNVINTTLGDNRYIINIANCGNLPTNNYYLLEVINSKNEKFYLKFKL